MRALAVLLSLMLTTMPAHAVMARYQEPNTFWPMAIGSLMFIAAIIFCITAMRRTVAGTMHKTQEVHVQVNEGNQ